MRNPTVKTHDPPASAVGYFLLLAVLCVLVHPSASQGCLLGGQPWDSTYFSFDLTDILDGQSQGLTNYSVLPCDSYGVLRSYSSWGFWGSWGMAGSSGTPTETTIVTNPASQTTYIIRILCDASVGDRIVPNGTTTEGITINGGGDTNRTVVLRSGCACGSGCSKGLAPVRTLQLHTAAVKAVRYHPTDPTEAVTASADGTCVFFNPMTGAVKGTLSHAAEVGDVQYSPVNPTDEVWTVSKGEVAVWSRKTYTKIRTVVGTGIPGAFGIRFHPTDSTVFAVLAYPNFFLFRSGVNLGPIAVHSLGDVLFHPTDATRMVQIGAEQFRTLSTQSGPSYGTEVEPLLSGEGKYFDGEPDPAAPSQRYFVVGRGLSIYDFNSGNREAYYTSNEWGFVFSVATTALNTSRIAVGCQAGYVKLFERERPEFVGKLHATGSTASSLSSLAFSPTSQDDLIGGSSDGAVRVWRYPGSAPPPPPSSPSSPPPSGGAAPPETGGLGGGAIAGIVIGAVAGVGLLVGAAVMLSSRSRNKSGGGDGYQRA